MLAIVSLCVVFALTGCKPPKVEKTTSTVANVGVREARLGDISESVVVTGSLESLVDVPLSLKQGGRLVEVAFNDGDTIRAGEVVARIDKGDLESSVRQAEAAVESSRANLENAKAAYNKQLVSTKSAIASARAVYEQQVAQSSSQVESARAALESAKEYYSEMVEGDRAEDRERTKANVQVAEANHKKAVADLQRYTKLHNAGAISDADMDKYQNALDTAEAELRAVKAAALAQENGNRRQDIAQAKQKMLQAEEALRQAIAARSTDAVKKADLESALAGEADNTVKLAQVRSAKAALKQSLANLAIAKQALKDAVLVSPVDGVVYNRSAEPGQVVSAGAPVVHVVSLDDVYYEPSVPNAEIGKVHVGDRVTLSVDAVPGKTFSGTVTRINPKSSSADRTVSLRITISNHQHLLRPGNYANGTVTTAVHRQVVIVPDSAIVEDSGSNSSYVFVAKNGVAKKRNVKKGFSSEKDGSVEVNGVGAGEQVIVNGLTGLVDGKKIAARRANLNLMQ